MQAVDWLDANAIRSAARAVDARAAAELNLLLTDLEASTNSRLLDLAKAGAASGTVLACEWQTAGRGRLGRQWLAPPASQITVSILWRSEKGAATLAGLSLTVSVAAAAALARLGASGIGVKWPNDLVHVPHPGEATQAGKLGGILIEVQGDTLGPTQAVIGVGLNLSRPPARQLPGVRVAGLSDALQPLPSRSVILGTLLGEIGALLRRFQSRGFDADMHAAWSRLDAFRGRLAEVTLGGHKVRARLLGIDASGALRVEIAGRERRLPSAEIGGVDAH